MSIHPQHLTGHAIHGFARHYAYSRVSRQVSWSFGFRKRAFGLYNRRL